MSVAAICVPNLVVFVGAGIPLFLVFMMMIALYRVYNRMIKDKRYLFDCAMDKT